MANWFQKMFACAAGSRNSPGTTESYALEGYLCWIESDLKNKYLKYKKSLRLTFEISLLVKKINFFSSKTAWSCRTEFSPYWFFFTVRKFRRTECSPYGTLAVRNFCRKEFSQYVNFAIRIFFGFYTRHNRSWTFKINQISM